jgi:hypothetical protein
MIGATQSIGNPSTVLPQTDEHVLETDFLQRPYVFEEVGEFYPSQLFLDGNYSEVFMVKSRKNSHYRVLSNGGEPGRWVSSFTGKEKFQAAELVKPCNGKNTVKGVRFTRGVFSEGVCPDEKEFLAKHTIGTYFIHARSSQWRIYVKTSEKDFYRFNIRSWYDDLNNAAPDFHREIDRIVEDVLSDYFTSPHPLQHLKGKLRLCQTSLDLSVFSELAPDCFCRILDGFTADCLKGVEEITFFLNDSVVDLTNGNPIKKMNMRNNFIILLAYLGIMNRTDIKLKYYVCQQDVPEYTNDFCREALEKLQQLLQGPQLEWAMDHFLTGVFSGTHCINTDLKIQAEDTSLQRFYNDETKEPTIKILLPHSKEVIFAHKTHLAKISDMFYQCLFNKQWRECQSGVFPFDVAYSDKAIIQFIRLAYGYNPDFTDIDPYDVIELANFLESSILLNYANKYFNNINTTVNVSCLIRLIENDLWQKLPAKSKFFQRVGIHWRKIMDRVPNEDKQKFRDDFSSAWSKYMNTRYSPNLIKV